MKGNFPYGLLTTTGVDRFGECSPVRNLTSVFIWAGFSFSRTLVVFRRLLGLQRPVSHGCEDTSSVGCGVPLPF
jgi:hypothetical protein